MDLDWLFHPTKVWSKAEVFTSPCPVPNQAGIYAWYFKDIPPLISTKDCILYQDLVLLYVGISPKKPAISGKKSSQNLRHRIKNHFRGNAEGSTLRLSLGCLLQERLEIRLQRIGSSSNLTFGEGENTLSIWMAENANAIWLEQEEPWLLEDGIIRKVSLPLNLQGNESHPFYPTLSAIRNRCKEKARK